MVCEWDFISNNKYLLISLEWFAGQLISSLPELTEKTNIIVHNDNSMKASGLCETQVNFWLGNNYIFFQTCMQPTSNKEHFPIFPLSNFSPVLQKYNFKKLSCLAFIFGKQRELKGYIMLHLTVHRSYLFPLCFVNDLSLIHLFFFKMKWKRKIKSQDVWICYWSELKVMMQNSSYRQFWPHEIWHTSQAQWTQWGQSV